MDKETQKKVYMYRILKNQQELFTEQLGLVNQGIEDLITTREIIEEMKKHKGKEILAPLGKECFVRADIRDERVVVDLGAGVLGKKSPEKAVEILESRRKELEAGRKEVYERLAEVNGKLAGLEPEVQEILEQGKE